MKIDNFITEADDTGMYNQQKASLGKAKSATGSKTSVSIAQKG